MVEEVHPLRDVSDVQFLRQEVANRKIVAERVNAAAYDKRGF